MTRIYTIPVDLTEAQIPAASDVVLDSLNQLYGLGLLAEPNATGPARGPLTRWVGYEFGNPRITHQEAKDLLGVTPESPAANLEAGDPNPFFAFIDSIDKSGNFLERTDTEAKLVTVNNDDLKWIDVNRCLLLYAVGGDVEGLTVFFVVPEANYQDDVPVGFPFSTITELVDEEEVTRQRTWEEWKSPNHTHELIEGNYYIPSTSWGVHMKASEWVPFVLGGLVTTVVDRPVVAPE